MPEEPGSLVGRTYGPGEYTVEPWLAHLWADATRNEDDRYRRSAGDGPPTDDDAVDADGASTHDDASSDDDAPDGDGGSTADGAQYAPPTLAQVVAREAAGTGDIEADLRGGDWDDLSVFLGGQRCTFEGPLRAGETYRATAEVVGVEEKEGASGPFRVVTVAYDVETAAGAPAFDLETDLVVRGDG